MHDCQSAHPSYWYKSGCVALTQCIITLRFAFSSSNVWLSFQTKNNVKSAPACTALTLVSHQSHNTRIANRHLHGKGERNRVQRRALVEPRCKHWSCCSWRKGTSPDKATLNSEEIKPLAIASIKLHLSEGISKGVCEWVSQSVSQYTVPEEVRHTLSATTKKS